MVGDVVGDVIIRIGRTRHAIMILEQDWLELARVPGIETVEIIESEPAGPMIERSNFAGFPRRRVVVLADPRGCVAVLSQYSETVPALFGTMPV